MQIHFNFNFPLFFPAVNRGNRVSNVLWIDDVWGCLNENHMSMEISSANYYENSDRFKIPTSYPQKSYIVPNNSERLFINIKHCFFLEWDFFKMHLPKSQHLTMTSSPLNAPNQGILPEEELSVLCKYFLTFFISKWMGMRIISISLKLLDFF